MASQLQSICLSYGEDGLQRANQVFFKEDSRNSVKEAVSANILVFGYSELMSEKLLKTAVNQLFKSMLSLN